MLRELLLAPGAAPALAADGIVNGFELVADVEAGVFGAGAAAGPVLDAAPVEGLAKAPAVAETANALLTGFPPAPGKLSPTDSGF